MKKKGKLKCLVFIGGDYSELLSEIEATPSRERASRLRLLAHTGLMSTASPLLYSEEFKNKISNENSGPAKIKCLVLLGGDYLELLNDIEPIPMRERASRLRLLAHRGLMSIKKQHATLLPGDAERIYKGDNSIINFGHKEDISVKQAKESTLNKNDVENQNKQKNRAIKMLNNL